MRLPPVAARHRPTDSILPGLDPPPGGADMRVDVQICDRIRDGGQRALLFSCLFAVLITAPAFARSTASPPPLVAPTGTIVNVATESELQGAVSALRSNTTIVLAAGTYRLTKPLYVNGALTDIVIRGATKKPNDVVLLGPGMNPTVPDVPYGIWTGGGVQRITIANLTIRDVYNHPIIFNAGTQSPRVYNVHLINAGQQFIKSNPDSSGGGVNNGIVE